jgi:hypothetical protein
VDPGRCSWSRKPRQLTETADQQCAAEKLRLARLFILDDDERWEHESYAWGGDRDGNGRLIFEQTEIPAGMRACAALVGVPVKEGETLGEYAQRAEGVCIGYIPGGDRPVQELRILEDLTGGHPCPRGIPSEQWQSHEHTIRLSGDAPSRDAPPDVQEAYTARLDAYTALVTLAHAQLLHAPYDHRWEHRDPKRPNNERRCAERFQELIAAAGLTDAMAARGYHNEDHPFCTASRVLGAWKDLVAHYEQYPALRTMHPMNSVMPDALPDFYSTE